MERIRWSKRVQQQVSELLRAGGFNLRKGASNSQDVLQHVIQEHRAMNIPLDIAANESIKTFGIHWNPSKDQFGFKVNINLN